MDEIEVWTTDTALGTGIIMHRKAQVHDYDLHKGDCKPFLLVKDGRRKRRRIYGEGTHWHRTPEAALAQAEAMRLKAIESTRRALARFETMTFTVKDAPEK